MNDPLIFFLLKAFIHSATHESLFLWKRHTINPIREIPEANNLHNNNQDSHLTQNEYSKLCIFDIETLYTNCVHDAVMVDGILAVSVRTWNHPKNVHY